MNRITLYTVQHTGTHFVKGFLELLGAKLDWSVKVKTGRVSWTSPIQTLYWPVHATNRPISEFPEDVRIRYERILCEDRKLIVTARDPYLSAIHYSTQSSSGDINYLADMWDVFLDTVESRNPFVLDIGCREEDRYQHLCEAVDYMEIVGCDNDVIKKYADSWKPQNQSNNAIKDEYFKNKILPDLGGDWSKYGRAVTWYKSLETNSYE